MSKKLLIPLAIFVGLCGFLLVGLWRDPREVPSPLIGKAAPPFTLNQLHEPAKTLGPADLTGVLSVGPFAFTADEKGYAYACRRTVSHLFLVEGAR
jgi:hypothetical protein